jgi:hypothetical protein
MRHLPGHTLLEWAGTNQTYDLFDPPVTVQTRQDALVRPVIVGETGEIVWGFRYRALWEAGQDETFPVLEVDRDACTVKVAVVAENRPGGYGLSELSRIRSLLEGVPAGEERWRELLPRLGDDVDPVVLVDRFRALHRGLAREVDAGQIDLRTAEAIPPDLADSAEALLSLFRSLSFSNRRQALRMSVELLRSGMPVGTIMAGLKEIPAAEIVGWLRERRYPTLSEMERRFSEVKRRSLRGTGVDLHPPVSFEGDRYEIRFAFRSLAELRARTAATLRLEDEIDELMDLLF